MIVEYLSILPSTAVCDGDTPALWTFCGFWLSKFSGLLCDLHFLKEYKIFIYFEKFWYKCALFYNLEIWFFIFYYIKLCITIFYSMFVF